MNNSEIIKTEPAEIVQEERVIFNSEDLETDYKYSRETLKEIITQGKKALDDALSVARQNDSPRAYEVVGGLIKNVGEAADKLIDLQQKLKNIEKEEIEEKAQQVTNNNAVFVGSTDELTELLFNRNKDG